MKKLYTLLLAVAGCLPATALTTPYMTALGDVNTKSVDAAWTVVNHNNDDKTWAYDNATESVTGFPAGIIYNYAKLAADDWAISPGLDLVAGTEYVITYWIKDSSTRQMEILEVYVGTTTDVDELSQTLLKQHTKFTTTFTKQTLLFTPEATGTYHFALKAATSADQYNLSVRGFKIKENGKSYPAAPSNLSITVAPEMAMSASLSWTLPTKDDEGQALSGSLTAVKVERDGQLIATLAGDATEYADDAIDEPGFHTYTVTAELGETIGFGASATSKWVGPKVALKLPYDEDFSDTDFVSSFWTFIDANGDGVETTDRVDKNNSKTLDSWSLMQNMAGSVKWVQIYTKGSNDQDDWLVSPPLAFSSPGKYKLSFRLSIYTGQTKGCSLTPYIGRDETAEALTTPLGDKITSVSKTSQNPKEGDLFEYEVEVAEAGTYYFGLHSDFKAPGTTHKLHFGTFHAEMLEAYASPEPEPEPMTPPFDSTADQTWAPTASLLFALTPGYYHATWECADAVTVSADDATIDEDFAEEFAVIKVTAETTAEFASAGEMITAFAIEGVDHTPGVPENCSYILGANGEGTLTFDAPALNISGSALYEIESVQLHHQGELVADLGTCQPGSKAQFTIPASDPGIELMSETDMPEYTITLKNLSGASEPVAAEYITLGVENIAVDAAGQAKLYQLDGTEVRGALTPGLYIELRQGKATKVLVK